MAEWIALGIGLAVNIIAAVGAYIAFVRKLDKMLAELTFKVGEHEDDIVELGRRSDQHGRDIRMLTIEAARHDWKVNGFAG